MLKHLSIGGTPIQPVGQPLLQLEAVTLANPRRRFLGCRHQLGDGETAPELHHDFQVEGGDVVDEMFLALVKERRDAQLERGQQDRGNAPLLDVECASVDGVDDGTKGRRQEPLKLECEAQLAVEL